MSRTTLLLLYSLITFASSCDHTTSWATQCSNFAALSTNGIWDDCDCECNRCIVWGEIIGFVNTTQQIKNTFNPVGYRMWTFDGLGHCYEGKCAYELATPCMGNYDYRQNGMPFSIQANKNSWPFAPFISVTDAIYITLWDRFGNIDDIYRLEPGPVCSVFLY